MSRRICKILLFTAVLAAALCIVPPSSILVGEPGVKRLRLTLDFCVSALKISRVGGRDIVFLKQPRCKYPADKSGAPELPARFVRLVVPRRAKFEKVTVTGCQTRKLRGKYDVDFVKPACRPGQKPPPAAPDAGIYGADKVYPAEKVVFLRAGTMRGHQILFFRINPIQYMPRDKELLFHSQIQLRVEYSLDNTRSFRLKPRGKSKAFQRMLKKFVENPADLNTAAEGESDAVPKQGVEPLDAPMGPGDDVQYLIICSEVFATTFQQLADWKKQKGVPAEVVTTEYISTAYSVPGSPDGNDTQTRIKRCIIDYVNNSGTVYVLLGGDIDTVPDRDCYGFVNGGKPWNDDPDLYIPTDLYYAGLDDIDWNDDGDAACGDANGDTIDMEPDVFVGRYSCKTAAQVEAYVNKVLEYEKDAPATGFCKEILLSGASAWGYFDEDGDYHQGAPLPGWKSDSEVWSIRLYDECIAPYQPLNKKEFFDTTASLNLTANALETEIDKGYGFVNMSTHGNVNVWGMESGPGYVTSDAASQTNDKEYPVICTIACITNAFDGWIYGDSTVCLSEGFTRNPDGGAIGYVGSSRYGWGAPGSYHGGASFIYNRTFYEKLLGEGLYHLGEAFTEHKWELSDRCSGYGAYRWLQFAINLMGDPELPVWTDNPQTMAVVYPPNIPTGSQTIYIKAEPGALVCLWKVVGASDEVYVYGYADESGVYSAVINPATEGTMKLTVTKHNYYPVEKDITVTNTPSLYIVTVALPGGETGSSYSAVLSAAGGTTPYSWSDTGGALPDGLTLYSDGSITGTPTTAGSSTFTVEVLDSVSDTATREFTIAVSLDTPVLQDFSTTEYNGSYTAIWTGDCPAALYELQEAVIKTTSVEDVESGGGQWITSSSSSTTGFSVSSTRSHSASHSFYTGMKSTMQTTLTHVDAITVTSTTQISYWCWYDIETNYDYVYLEVLPSGEVFWKTLKTYTGSSGGWAEQSVNLSSYAGSTIRIRFRYLTDVMIEEEGFYIDDISLTGFSYMDWTTLDANIPVKYYDRTGRAPGTYYYRVRAFEGANTSDWSEIKSITVLPNALFVDFSVDPSLAKPYGELTYYFRYDNDNYAQVASFVLEAPVPSNTTYVADSAEGANSPHSGASITVTYYDGSVWHIDTWDNADANAELVERIKWTFSTAVGVDSGGDTEGVCDGSYPDTDSGEVTYKVTIK